MGAALLKLDQWYYDWLNDDPGTSNLSCRYVIGIEGTPLEGVQLYRLPHRFTGYDPIYIHTLSTLECRANARLIVANDRGFSHALSFDLGFSAIEPLAAFHLFVRQPMLYGYSWDYRAMYEWIVGEHRWRYADVELDIVEDLMAQREETRDDVVIPDPPRNVPLQSASATLSFMETINNMVNTTHRLVWNES